MNSGSMFILAAEMENKGTGASAGQLERAQFPLGSVLLYIKTTQTHTQIHPCKTNQSDIYFLSTFYLFVKF